MIGIAAVELFRELKRQGLLSGIDSVCELGSQVLAKKQLKGAATATSAKQFYENLGIASYCSIDLDGMHNALEYDLNLALREVYGLVEKFGLVTNFGTSEHCFSQEAVFRNAHNLCKVNGLMVHYVPTQGWDGHGFYRYDSNFFNDLARANEYEIVYKKNFDRKPRGVVISRVLKKTSDAEFAVPLQSMGRVGQRLKDKT